MTSRANFWLSAWSITAILYAKPTPAAREAHWMKHYPKYTLLFTVFQLHKTAVSTEDVLKGLNLPAPQGGQAVNELEHFQV